MAATSLLPPPSNVTGPHLAEDDDGGDGGECCDDGGGGDGGDGDDHNDNVGGANLPESTLRTTQTQTQHCELSPSQSLKGGFLARRQKSQLLTETENSQQALLKTADKHKKPRLGEKLVDSAEKISWWQTH